MATYPAAYPVWSTKYDYTTVVMADHINAMQRELVDGIQRTLGLTPQIARTDPGSTPFDLFPVLAWLGEVPPGPDMDDVIDIIRDNHGSTKHNYDSGKVLEVLKSNWPQWSDRYPY